MKTEPIISYAIRFIGRRAREKKHLLRVLPFNRRIPDRKSTRFFLFLWQLHLSRNKVSTFLFVEKTGKMGRANAGDPPLLEMIRRTTWKGGFWEGSFLQTLILFLNAAYFALGGQPLIIRATHPVLRIKNRSQAHFPWQVPFNDFLRANP